MKKLLTSDTFFLVAVLMAALGAIPFSICCLMIWMQYSYMAAIVIVNGVSAVAFYISYRKHSKNVMKGLGGFLLMGLLSLTILATFPLDPADSLYIVLSLANLLVVLILCINHFVINSDHHSKSANIRLNQVLLFAQFVLYIVMAAKWIADISGAVLILYIIGIPVTAFGVTASIVCVESRLDAYRLDREAAGWTEEKGYPEGYVHEYEKQQRNN